MGCCAQIVETSLLVSIFVHVHKTTSPYLVPISCIIVNFWDSNVINGSVRKRTHFSCQLIWTHDRYYKCRYTHKTFASLPSFVGVCVRKRCIICTYDVNPQWRDRSVYVAYTRDISKWLRGKLIIRFRSGSSWCSIYVSNISACT